MKRIFPAIALLLTFGCLTASAQKDEVKLANSLLWKVKAPSGAESYLFGTYHLIGSDYLKTNTRVNKAIESSSKIVVETVIDSTKLMALSGKMMMTDNSLKNLVDSADYTLLKEKIEPVLGYDLILLNQLKPMVISSLYAIALAQKLTPEEFIYDGQKLDLYIANTATKAGKEVISLETMEEQMDLLYNSESVEDQADALVDMVKKEEDTEELTVGIIEAYREEDLNSMWNRTMEMEQTYIDMDVFLGDRNTKWIEKLVPLLNEGDLFIAVGALHLPGDGGLIDLLKAEGYTVSPVK